MEIVDQLRESLGGKLKEHKSLKEFTSMRVGGVADYFVEVDQIEDLVKAVQAAVNSDIPYLVIGGGSNIIVSDYGYPGLVILNKTATIGFLQDKTQVMADSGVYLAHLINKAAAIEFGGLEFLIGVPGSVGGAVYNNASCWGGAISEYVRGITLLLPGEEKGERSRVINIEPDELKFGYHTSFLKEASKQNDGRKPVILSVKFQLTSLRREEIMRRIKQCQELRMQKQPVGEFSAGSIFKNPSGFASSGEGEEKNFSAGYLIDQSGGKKLKVGGALVSKKHANFVINNGKATASEIRELIEKIKALVMEKNGISLTEEVEFIGQWDREMREDEV